MVNNKGITSNLLPLLPFSTKGEQQQRDEFETSWVFNSMHYSRDTSFHHRYAVYERQLFLKMLYLLLDFYYGLFIGKLGHLQKVLDGYRQKISTKPYRISANIEYVER